ncbi:MAG: Rrf2 family transcriptional regulator [Ignavibacteria bacterium]|jgi:Rrf2 family protein|nr:Rrf2 family transcriptional regulator [Ignavibacteria bacterium]
MLKLSKKVEYAIIAIKSIYDQSCTESVSAKVISDEKELSFELLAKVLQKLVKAGIIVSSQGIKGGYRLNHSPNSITLLMIIDAVEKNISLTNCLNKSPENAVCSHQNNCCIKNPITKIQTEIESYFNKTTIDKL